MSAAAAAGATHPPGAADRRSPTRVLLTAPITAINCHIPASSSPACREGSITAEMNREYVAVMTSTGKIAACPCPTRPQPGTSSKGEEGACGDRTNIASAVPALVAQRR